MRTCVVGRVGAEASSVVLLAIRQIVWPVAVGIVIGVAVLWPAIRVVEADPIQALRHS